mmetsp:Transcript_10504/g.18559  ORF Transcript_10504/g.18559 Transcript_10504/m.18559 type:complete len:388 (-) Transcript_10504:265-1428(-)
MSPVPLPSRMLVGGGVVKQVGSLVRELGLSRPLLVSDPFLGSNGIVKTVSNAMQNVKHDVFTDTIAEPTTDSIDKLRAALETGRYDSIVAVGGGSPMDSAKAAAVLAVHGGQMRDYKAPFQMNEPSLPIVAIPTTAGTGSEVTQFTIVTDSQTEEKMLCVGNAYIPAAAVVDYELTLTMPPRLTADSAIDAMCHAMEAYVSVKRNPHSQKLSLDALSKLSNNIRQACENPSDHKAREALMLGSNEAGIAFSNSSVTLIHGMSRPIGALFHVPHGLSNAMLAPAVTAFSVAGAVGHYADVARAMGMCASGVSNEDAAEALPKELFSLANELKVPSLKDWGVDEELFRKAIPTMAAAALASGSPNNNPRVPTQEEIESLYMTIFRGQLM